MQDTEMIDFELWLISTIRAICQREGVRLPSIARADELLDERLSLQRAVRLCRRRQAPARQFPDDRSGTAVGLIVPANDEGPLLSTCLPAKLVCHQEASCLA